MRKLLQPVGNVTAAFPEVDHPLPTCQHRLGDRWLLQPGHRRDGPTALRAPKCVGFANHRMGCFLMFGKTVWRDGRGNLNHLKACVGEPAEFGTGPATASARGLGTSFREGLCVLTPGPTTCHSALCCHPACRPGRHPHLFPRVHERCAPRKKKIDIFMRGRREGGDVPKTQALAGRQVSFGCGKAYGAAVAGLRGLRALGDLERERSGRCRLRAALRLVGDALILRRSRRVSPCAGRFHRDPIRLVILLRGETIKPERLETP